MTAPVVDPEAVMLTVVEAAAVMRTTRQVLYRDFLSTELLPSVKVGRKRLVRRSDLLRLIEGLPPDPVPRAVNATQPAA